MDTSFGRIISHLKASPLGVIPRTAITVAGVFLLGYTTNLSAAVGQITGYVQNQTATVQPGGFNTQTGTVGQFTDTSLSANQCVQTGPGGQLFTTGSTCGAGGGAGGASLLGVNFNGVSVTTPTAQINFVGGAFSVSAIGSTATVTMSQISLSTGVTGSLPAASIAAGSLGPSVIASSHAVNSIYPASVAAGTYPNITLPAANIASGYTGSMVIISSAAPSSIGVPQLNFTGTASSSTFARGDGSWQSVGSVTGVTAGPGLSGGGSSGNITLSAQGVSLSTQITGVLPIANGGNGTASPGVLQGSNMLITGSWPNQILNAVYPGGGGNGAQVNTASQYSVPFYSASGSSNTLSGSANFTYNQTTMTVLGPVVASTFTATGEYCFKDGTCQTTAGGSGGSGGYNVQPATVTFSLNLGVTASTMTVSTQTVTGEIILKDGTIITSTTPFSGGSTSPGGSTSQVQYNLSGSFAGSSNFTTDGSSVSFSTATATGPIYSNEFIPNGVSNTGGGILGTGGGLTLIGGNADLVLSPGSGFRTFVTQGSTFAFVSSNGYTGFFAPPSQTSTPIFYQLPSSKGTANQVLTLANSTGTLTWTTGSGNPAAPLNSVQFNSTGTFNGSPNFTTDGSSVTVSTMVANNLMDVGPNISITSSTQQIAITNTQATGVFFDPSSILLTRSTGKNNCIGFKDPNFASPMALCGNQTQLILGSQDNTGGFNGNGALVLDANNVFSSTVTIQTNAFIDTSANVQFKAFNSTLSSETVTGSGGLAVPYGVNAGSMTGAGLTSCSGASNAVSWNSSTNLFGCNTISGGSSGASSLAVTTGSASGFVSVASSPTAVVNLDSTTFKVSLQGGATAYITSISTITAASLGALTGNQSITLSGDASGSGATAITVTAAATQANIRTLSGPITFTSSATFTNDVIVSSAVLLGGVPGTNGQVFTSLGNGSNPAWTTITGGSGIVSPGTFTWTNNQGITVSTFTSSNLNTVLPSTPVVVGTLNSATLSGSGWSWENGGRYAYVDAINTTTFTVVDVSSPTKPIIVAQVSDGNLLNGTEGIACAGKYCYVTAYYGNTVSVIDVSNPFAPTIVGHITDNTNLINPESINIYGSWLIIVCTNASGNGELTSLDISNPKNPQVRSMVTNVSMNNPAVGALVGKKYFYVGSELNDYVSIMDISNPASLVYVSSINVGVNTVGMVATDRYVYVVNASANPGQLLTLDAKNPTAPVLVNTVNTGSSFQPWVLAPGINGYLYATDYNNGYVGIYDITKDPSAPSFLNKVSVAGGIDDIKVQGRYAYVTGNSSSQFFVLDLLGMSASTIQAASINASDITATDYIKAGNFTANDGAVIGPGGILDQGDMAVSGNAVVVGSVTTPSIIASSGTISTLSISSNTVLAGATFYANGPIRIGTSETVGVQIGKMIIPQGLDPTCQTDNTAAIQNAINLSSSTGGGTVYIPAPFATCFSTSVFGGYQVQNLQFASGVTLAGDMPEIYPAPSQNNAIADFSPQYPSGGTWLNCKGQPCGTGTNMRGFNLYNIGFTSWTASAVTLGGNNSYGDASAAWKNVYFIGSPSVNVSSVAITSYNPLHLNMDHIQIYNANVGLYTISQSTWIQPGNSVISDLYVYQSPTSVANGNSNTPAIWLQVSTPTTGGSPTQLDEMTFIRPQINSFGGDATGVQMKLQGVSTGTGEIFGVDVIDGDFEGSFSTGAWMSYASGNQFSLQGLAQNNGNSANTFFMQNNSYYNLITSDDLTTTVDDTAGQNLYYGWYASSSTNMNGYFRIGGGNNYVGGSNTLQTLGPLTLNGAFSSGGNNACAGTSSTICLESSGVALQSSNANMYISGAGTINLQPTNGTTSGTINKNTFSWTGPSGISNTYGMSTSTLSVTGPLSVGAVSSSSSTFYVVASSQIPFMTYLSTSAAETGGFGVNISTSGHLNVFNSSSTFGPTITNGSGDASCSDVACTITASGSPVTFTFTRPYTNVPVCTVTEQTDSLTNALSYSKTKTAITITQTGLSGNLLDVICIGRDTQS